MWSPCSCEDYDKGVLDAALRAGAHRAAQEVGIPVVVDPKQRHFFDYAGVTVFKPNLRELESAFGTRLRGRGS